MPPEKDLKASDHHQPSQFGALTGLFFTMNLIIGAGILGLPYSFKVGGWLVCGLYTVICCSLGYIWSSQLVELTSRCCYYLQLKEKGISLKKPTLKQILFGKNKNKTDLETNLISNEDSSSFEITKRIDISEMVEITLGKKWKAVYFYSFVLTFLLTLSSYAVIFSSSLASNLEIGFLDSCDIYKCSEFSCECWKTYWFFLAIFSVIVVYLTLVEMNEQKVIQNIITGSSVLNIIIVITLSVISIIEDTEIDSDRPLNRSDYDIANISNIGISLPIILFASMIQLSLPSIIENLDDKRTNVKPILRNALIASLLIYLPMGFIVPMAVSKVYGQYNISFRNYSAGYSQAERPWWTYIFSYFIVLSPAIGILSAFALIAIPLAHNTESYFYGIGNKNISKREDYLVKLLVVVVPLALSTFVYNLGSIMSVAGAISILMVPVGIPLMHIAGRELIEKESVYDCKYSPRIASLIIAALHCGILILKIYFLF
ncbi:unnamed protein product [Blepharisma stoltei]|uniref:Amino acid transporter transmembrane domain-containing protein n=1 Tax=Blepharisma stoltei TaxID=1481888 RepID=A0AAU9KH97_9CILI|nr:unnamed protein product [Blepharisma stoltei]